LSAISVIFVARVGLTSTKRVRAFLRLFLASTSVSVLLTLLQGVGALGYQRVEWQAGSTVGRGSGLYEHPLNLVLFLIMAIPAALYLASVERGVAKRALYLGFVGASMYALLLSTHRAGLLAGVLVLLAWVLCLRRPTMTIAVSAGVVLSALLLWDQLTALFAAGLAGTTFLRGRGPIWTAFTESWLNAGPVQWLVGSAFPRVVSDTPLLGALVSEEPHNDFLRMLVTYGIVGLLCYLTLIALFIAAAWRAVRHGAGDLPVLGRVVGLAMLAVLLLSLTAEPSRYPSGTWALFAVGAYVAHRVTGTPRPGPTADARGEGRVGVLV
jgi:O-antigen ligase